MLKKNLLISLFILVFLLLINVAAAGAATIEWGPVQHGFFSPYYDSNSNSDEGFDLSTGQMTTDPAKRDFIIYQGLWLNQVKGIEFFGEELLTAVSEEPDSLTSTDDWLLTDMTYFIRCHDNTYAKLIATRERPEGVEFDYVLQKGAQTPATANPGTSTPSTNTPSTNTSGTTTPSTTVPSTSGPVTIINNTTNINQNTNTTTNNANTNTNITGSTIANSNVASNNQTSQTTSNENAITVTQYVNATVNGQPLQSDVQPFINGDGRTMLPVRAISEALGAQVQWDDANQTATLTLGGIIVKVAIGQKYIDVNGNPVPMDTAAVIKDGRTLLPVRSVGEALGATIGWNEQTQTVSIDK